MSESPAMSTEGPRVFVEPWGAGYGSPMHIDPSEPDDPDSIISEEGFKFVPPTPEPVPDLAFVDGRRRQEAALTYFDAEGFASGLAGVYAVGAVLTSASSVAQFFSPTVHRVVVWSDGRSFKLPDHPAGWKWETETTTGTAPNAPMMRLQELMRLAEASVANQVAESGRLVLLDGTLSRVETYRQRGIAGYVKTHHKRLLPTDEARLLPELPSGQRTTLLRTGSDHYTFYLRLASTSSWHSPLAGIVRIELPGNLSIDDARVLADTFSSALPRYAGIAHIDPRAPQNLQPTGALEMHLSHLMGDPNLAERAVRDVIATLNGGQS